ncbi:uncharacterized protein LOC127873440 isoform X2 [Dreissena polymorpha]|uniref:uncharacterized protein LOC127873440 isoform X2 n=1 Tax=Dreissena polymorpha TaxID=45954 RepID=UPI0022654CC9|nr:uncharacterized protein LOC127873440 isoform X2 [Dreissena polymorpha]
MIQMQHFQLWILLLLQVIALPFYASATGLGVLSILKPTILGRNITLQLNLSQPLKSEQFAECALKIMFDGQKTLQTINNSYSRFENDGVKMIEIDRASVNKSWEKAFLHVDCNKNKVSNYVLLEFQGDRPVLGPLCAGLNCTYCLCVKPGDKIKCITSSTKVTLWIGNRTLQGTSVDSDYTYISHDAIMEEDHQITAICSATYDNNSVLNTSAFVYVYIPPKDFVLFVPELLEDSHVNITCIARRGRPSPMLEMYLDGENITGVSQHDVFDENTSTYTSVSTLRWANRTWDNKNITCRLFVRKPDGKYVFERSTSTTVNYKYRPAILSVYVNKTCGHSEEVCLTCFVRGNPLANISLRRPGQNIAIIECLNTTECNIKISKSAIKSSEYECMASNLIGTARQTITIQDDLKGKETHNTTEVSNLLKSVMIGVGVSVMVVFTVIIMLVIREFRRRKESIPKLIPMNTQVEDTPLQQLGHGHPEEVTATIEHHYDEIKDELGATQALNQQTIVNEQIAHANIHFSATIEHNYEDIEDELGATQVLCHQRIVNQQVTPNVRPCRDPMCIRNLEGAVRFESSKQPFELKPINSLANPAAYEVLKRSDSDPGHKYTSLKPRCTSLLEENYVNII